MKQYFESREKAFEHYDVANTDPTEYGFGIGLDETGWYVVKYKKEKKKP